MARTSNERVAELEVRVARLEQVVHEIADALAHVAGPSQALAMIHAAAQPLREHRAGTAEGEAR